MYGFYDRSCYIRMDKINLVIIGGIRTHYIKIYTFQEMLKIISPELVSKFNYIYIDAGQHYDKSLHDNFIEDLGIKFDYTLRHEGKRSEDLWGSMLTKLCLLYDELACKKSIDYVVVFGDVITTVIASFGAMLKKVKIVHVESGVRVKHGINIEENCRIATDHIAKLRFTSNINDLSNLCSEGLNEDSYFSGDIIYDYLKNCVSLKKKQEIEYEYNEKKFLFQLKEEYVLVSIHHSENQSVNFIKNIFEVFQEIGINVLFIVHPTIKRLIKNNNLSAFNIYLADYISYSNNLYAISEAKYILTDSGGIQREAYYLNKRCIVRSFQTVWEEIVRLGSNLTIGMSPQELYRGIDWATRNRDCQYIYNESFGKGEAVYTILKNIYEDKKNEVV